MLIITRRIDERIMIGSDIQFTILGVHGNQVRIGVEAPRDVSVHREGVYRRINVHGSAAALAHGGSCDGAPGQRLHYSADFYAAYVRDPDGNKIAAACVASQRHSAGVIETSVSEPIIDGTIR